MTPPTTDPAGLIPDTRTQPLNQPNPATTAVLRRILAHRAAAVPVAAFQSSI